MATVGQLTADKKALDPRTIVENEEAIYNITQAYVGLIIYNKENGKLYKVTEINSLSGKVVNSIVLPPSSIGAQPEINNSNKLSADNIMDGNTNKVVTQAEKTTWNDKQNALDSTQLANINKGGTALQPSSTSGLLKNDGTIDTETQGKAANAIQMPAGASANKVLGYENGNVAWVAKPSDGLSAYELYVEEYKTAHSGDATGAKTEAEWLASLKAQFGSFVPAGYGTDGKPNDGTSDIIASADTTNNIYLVDNLASNPTAKTMWITVVNDSNPNNITYSWTSIGDVQVNLTFATGQAVNTVGIDDEPTIGSENLVRSGGVYSYLPKSEIKVDNPSYTEGVMHIDGAVDSTATTYGYTGAILLKHGARLILNQGSAFYHGQNTACVFKCDSNGVFESALVSTPYYQTIVTTYTNTSSDDIYVGISGYKSQLRYTVVELTEAASKNDFEEITSELEKKIDYFIKDVTNTEDISNNVWMRYENGIAQGGATISGQWTVRTYPCGTINKIYCKIGSDGSTPASIAFYNSKPTFTNYDTNYYLKDVSIQAQTGVKEYIIDIPEEATWVCVSNRGATFDSPVVKLYSSYSQEAIDAAILSHDSELLYQSANTSRSSAIKQAFDISTIENNTQLELEVTEVSGDSVLAIELLDAAGRDLYKRFDGAVGKYYFEKTPGLSKVRLDKADTEGNLYNWKLRTITKKYPIQNRTFAPFFPAKQVDIIDLGTPFSGYYGYTANQDAENTKVAAAYWVSWPLQKTNGFVIKIEFDATQYAINFSSFNETYQRRAETTITTSPVEIDLSSCRGWNLAIRKTSYTSITPAEVENAVTVTKVSGTIYEKPLLKYEVEKIVNNKVGDVNKALTLSKEGYGFNPFIEKPFYYHFAANDFIRDSQNCKAIASESVDDVELAARLGFGLIEANIQPTSDGHFVVIHGTSGTFGPECKSINPDVISTTDLQATAINSVTLDWIKTNVRYDSYYEKYQTTLPSLEEFCEACKKHNIGIFAGTNSKAAVDICVKYLGQNVVVYNPPANIRTYFNGWCFLWNNTTTTTVEQILTACRQMGAPVMYGLGPNLAAKLYTDDNMNTLIDSMHKEGFLVGWTANYDTEENGRKYHKLGMDFSSSKNDINPFEPNYEVFDIDSDNLPTTTGSVSNGIISLTNGQTITCGNASKIIGKAWLSVRFNGTLTFNFGSQRNTGRTITSDGSEDIVITDYFFMRDSTLYVNAHADTTVTKFLYKTSKC